MERKSMAEKSIIIVGAGLAGLSTGCYSQINGYRSRIFEHHSQPGGVAAAWKRNGYLIDGGIHFLMGHRPGHALYPLYQELGITQGGRFLDMTNYCRYQDEASGLSVDFTSDLSQLSNDLKALSPGDSVIIDDLISGARAFQGAEMNQLEDSRPPELTTLWSQAKMFWGMRKQMKYFSGKYSHSVAEYAQNIRHPWLRKVIENLFLPEVPVWFVLMLLALLADRQMGLLEGGSLEFARSIEKRYQALGGQVHYKATVEEILVENDKAVGVRLAKGDIHRADMVVSAADGYSTIYKMLNGRYKDAKIDKRYSEWKLFRPFVSASYGVARQFNNEPPLYGIFLQRPFKVGNQDVGSLILRLFNYSPHYAPTGKTVIQATFESDWDYWYNLHQDPASYETTKESIAAEILQRLEKHFLGISSQVEVSDVFTPYSTWRYTLNRNGAFEGWLPTPKVIMTQINRTLPGLESFYMAGQWVAPGGGVPPSLLTGRQAVQIICKRDGKKFITSKA
jgi:phytoene desaturase